MILLKGSSDEFAMSKTEKVSMSLWNPLLLAIAFKKLEMVRYFLHTQKIGLRIAGQDPTSEPSAAETGPHLK